MPAVMITTSLPATSFQSVVPVTRQSYPSTAASWLMSSAFPFTRPSAAGMS